MELDEVLFEKIAENDGAAFEELYKLTESSIYTFALSILKNQEDALDVMQDTYIKIRSSAHLYKPMGKPLAFMFTIAKNLSMSRLRLKERTNINLEEIENDASLSYTIDNEDKLELRSVLMLLGEQEREIILLHDISGLTHSEIAENLSIPLSTVLSKYRRALAKLRKYLE